MKSDVLCKELAVTIAGGVHSPDGRASFTYNAKMNVESILKDLVRVVKEEVKDELLAGAGIELTPAPNVIKG